MTSSQEGDFHHHHGEGRGAGAPARPPCIAHEYWPDVACPKCLEERGHHQLLVDLLKEQGFSTPEAFIARHGRDRIYNALDRIIADELAGGEVLNPPGLLRHIVEGGSK